MLSRPVRLLRPLVVAVAGLAFLASAGSARADVISFAGNTNSLSGTDPVSFSGTVTVTAGSSTSATVSVMLTNTTSVGDAVQKGYITGFGFNLPGTVMTAASATSTNANFKFLTNGTSGVSTSLQGGANDYAFSLSTKELHTIERNLGLTTAQANAFISTGLAAGQSATFTFVVSGTGAGSLTAAQLVTDTSGSGYPLSVRFRSTDPTLYPGHNTPDGDKVAAYTVATPPPPKGVPAPPGLVLAGMGFGCLLLGRLRRKTAAKA